MGIIGSIRHVDITSCWREHQAEEVLEKLAEMTWRGFLYEALP
jgi:hypothetical protein